MSSIYSTEPPTKGKVILHTTSGDIDVELWPKEAPKAVRNFVQLCLEGYYDGCLFHRVIPDLMIQTGDPSGTGLGGESVYGKPFGDELHSRLRFTRRGLVAAAGSSSGGGGEGGKAKGAAAAGSASGNTSQFFITLGPAPHLDRRHTIFGRVAAGDTIYTVAAIGEAEVDDQDRPCSDPEPRVVSAEVLWNPFDDVVPRTTAEERAAARAKEAKEKKLAEERAAKPGLVAVRDKKLLSFGDGEEEDEEEEGEDEEEGDDDRDDSEREEKEGCASEPETRRVAKKSKTGGIVSAHEAALGDSRLVAPDEADAAATLAEQEAVRERLANASKAASTKERHAATAEPAAAEERELEEPATEEDEDEREKEAPDRKSTPPPPPKSSTISSRRAAALEKGAAVRSSALPLASAKQAAAARVKESDAPLLTEWQRRHARFAARKKVAGKRDEATLRALDAFTARLRGSEGGGGGGDAGGGTTSTAINNTAAKVGAAVAAAAFIEQGDVSLREVAGHKMVARRDDDDEEGG